MIDRRDFIKLSIGFAAATSLGLKYFHFVEDGMTSNTDESLLIRSTCSPNDTGACGYMAYVNNGRISTLIQAADYPEKEYNPRGCLRGLSFMNLIYGKDRLKYPLIRTGQRGSGEFKKVSWEEALDYTANKLKEITEKYGSESIAATVQVGGTGYVQKGALVRLAALANWSIHHAYDQNGDLPMFWPMTFGVQSEELESLEWTEARYTMIFGANVLVTRLPDAQMLLKAKRNGKLVVFDPDYCPSAAKADEWVSLKPDTDAAVALGMAKIIIDKKLCDEDFLRDFTDMPILVRSDNGKRLLATEVKNLASEAEQREIPDYRSLFVIHNDNGLAILNPESLESSNAKLEGELEVELQDGNTVKARTVFSELKEHLKEYSLEKVSSVAEIPTEQIERIAVEAASTKPLHIIFGASNYQWYHGDLKGRAIALISILTGNLGKSGSGISTYAGQYKIRFNVKEWWSPKGGKLNWVPYLYFLNGRGKGYPRNGIKAMVGGWGNPFDQHNLSNILIERASSGELEFILTTDIQMTTSCQWSDVVLPVTSWYEKHDLTATPVHPYVQLQQPAIKPLFESRSELWIFRELARRLNPDFEKQFFPELDENEAALRIIKTLLATGGYETEGMTLEALQRGPIRLHSKAPKDRQIPFYEQIHDRTPFPPQTYPYPLNATAKFVRSGRVEFYKDEDTFLQLEEQLPTYKETFFETEYKVEPDAKNKYKLAYVTRNSLYRVHSTHSNNRWLNELQGDKPKVFLNEDDARERSIENGDYVEIFNSRGKTKGYAVIDKGALKGKIVFEQGWWSRYLNNESYNSLIIPWIKPTHEIYFVPGTWSPNTCWNECLVDVRRMES
jgi:anaerobic selenocysteine-containing dehydrogenase